MTDNSLLLLDLLKNNSKDGSDLQLAALDQLCLLILQMDSADTLKQLYPPSAYIPLLVDFFLNLETEAHIIETASRVLTYYLQILPFETTICFGDQEAIFESITIRMTLCNLSVQIENDLAQQIVKILEEYSKRETCVQKLIASLHNIFGFILNNWHIIHLDTLNSGLFVLSRLSGLVDIWISKRTEKDLKIKESSAYTSCIQELRGWIFQLVGLVLHNDASVTYGSLESLRNIVTSCRRLSLYSLNPLDKVTQDGRLLENLLILLTPNTHNETIGKQNKSAVSNIIAVNSTINDEFPGMLANKTNTINHRQLTGPLAALVVDLVLNLCNQQPGVLKSLATSPSFTLLLQTVLDNEGVEDKLSRTTKSDFTANSQLVIPILNFVDGLLYLILTMPAEREEEIETTVSVDQQSIVSFARTSSLSSLKKKVTDSVSLKSLDDDQLHQTNIQWRNFIRQRLAFVQGGVGSKGIFTSFLSPLISHGFSAFRSALDNLGLSCDPDVASLRFHLWLQHAIENHTNIVDLTMALSCVQVKNCWLDLMGQSLVTWAVQCRNPSGLMALTNRGVDVNAGLAVTPLHVAASRIDIPILRHLLELGSIGLAANPLLCDTQGRTPLQCCGLQATSNAPRKQAEALLRQAEEEFKAKFVQLREGTVGRLMSLILPVLIKAYRTSMRPSLRLQALRLITRICRSKSGHALLHRQNDDEDESTLDCLLNTITSALSQGCTSEVIQALMLISTLVSHQKAIGDMRRHGVEDFLRWRIAVESRIVQGEAGSAEEITKEFNKELEWANFLPQHLTNPKALSISDAKNNQNEQLNMGHQCIYELSWDQPYQFGDWTILRIGNSRMLIVQEFSALWIEAVMNSESKSPILVASLITRPDAIVDGSFTETDTAPDQLHEDAASLSIKTISMGSNSKSTFQHPTITDLSTIWPECRKYVRQLRGGTLGVLPLPLARSSFSSHKSSTSSNTGRGVRTSRPNLSYRNQYLPPQARLPRAELLKKHISYDSVLAHSSTSSPIITTPSSQTDEFDPGTPPRTNSESKSFASAISSILDERIHGVSFIQAPSEDSLPAPNKTVACGHDPEVSAIIALSGNSSQTSEEQQVSDTQLLEPVFKPIVKQISLTTAATSDSEQTTEMLMRDHLLGRLYVGLMVLTLSSSGLIVMIREPDGAEKFIEAARSNNEEHLMCNHLGCMNIWDPDFATEKPMNAFLAEIFPEVQTDTNQQSQSVPTYQVGSAKVVISPTRVGGIRTYGHDGMLIYRSIALARSSRLQRLIPILDPLNANQRQQLKNCHRDCYLRKLRDCVIFRGLEILHLLKTRQEEFEDSATKGSFKLLFMLAQACTSLADQVKNSKVLVDNMFIEQSLQSLRIKGDEKIKCMVTATPHEIIKSGIIPALLNCLESINYALEYINGPSKMLGIQSLLLVSASCYRSGSEMTPQLCLLKILFGSALQTFIKKIVKTFELIERYPVTSLHFTGLHDQLLQRSVQLQPHLIRSVGKSVCGNNADEKTTAAFCRQVDLSNHRIYATPLVTFAQLKQWLMDASENIPWHYDKLDDMAFVHDLRQTNCEIHLNPQLEKIVNPSGVLPTQALNAKVFNACGLFHWLATNGGRETRFRLSPVHLHGLVKVTTSDQMSNRRPMLLSRIILPELVEEAERFQNLRITTQKADSPIAPINFPWICIDTGVSLQLTHYSLRLPIDGTTWPSLQHWQLQGSTNGLNWTVLSEHRVYPCDSPSAYWSVDGERVWEVAHPKSVSDGFRLFRIISFPISHSRDSSFHHEIQLQNIEFYGHILRLSKQNEIDTNFIAYLSNLKPGVLVVPNNVRQQVPNTALYEIWPSERQRQQLSATESDENNNLVPMGLIASNPENGRIKVVWFKPTVTEVVTSLDDCETFSRIVSQHLSRFHSAWSSKQEKEKNNMLPLAPDSIQLSFDSHIQSHGLLSNTSLDLALPGFDDPVLKAFIYRIPNTDWSQVLTPEEAKTQCQIFTPSTSRQCPAILCLQESNIASPINEDAVAAANNHVLEVVDANVNNGSLTSDPNMKQPLTKVRPNTITPFSKSPALIPLHMQRRKRVWFLYEFPKSGGYVRAQGEDVPEVVDWKNDFKLPPIPTSVNYKCKLESNLKKEYNSTKLQCNSDNWPMLNTCGFQLPFHTKLFTKMSVGDEEEEEERGESTLVGTNNCAVEDDLIGLSLINDHLSELILQNESSNRLLDPGVPPLDFVAWIPPEGLPLQDLPFRLTDFSGLNYPTTEDLAEGDEGGGDEDGEIGCLVNTNLLHDSDNLILNLSVPTQPSSLDGIHFDMERICNSIPGRRQILGSPSSLLSVEQNSVSASCVQGPSKMVTLDVVIPGFIPPFDTRTGSSSQPTTVNFDPTCSTTEAAKMVTANKSRQLLDVWLTQHGRGEGEEEESQMDSSSGNRFARPQYSQDEDISLFHCWTDDKQFIEEFPGSGKPKRAVSPLSGAWQRGYNLNYSFESQHTETSLLNMAPHLEDSSIYSMVDNLPFVIPYFSVGVTSADLVDQLLSLLRVMYNLTTSTTVEALNDISTDNSENGGFVKLLSFPECPFYSTRLASKLHMFTNSTWSVIRVSGCNAHAHKQLAGGQKSADMYTWCRQLTQKANFLFPFKTVLDFWRATSLGLSRSIAWLQKQPQNSNGVASGNGGVGGGTSTGKMTIPNYGLGSWASRFAASDFGYIWGKSALIDRLTITAPDSIRLNNTDISNASLNIPYGRFPAIPSLQSGTGISMPLINREQHGGGGLIMLGRLQREFARVPRPLNEEEYIESGFLDEINTSAPTFCDNNLFWNAAKELVFAHSSRKQELEIGFENEEGTGLGPTMEFYALLSTELRKKSHGLWVADYNQFDIHTLKPDMVTSLHPSVVSNLDFEGVEEEIGCCSSCSSPDTCYASICSPQSSKMESAVLALPGGIYVTPKNGLFPAAWPADELPPGCEERFRILGISIAKCLQDERQMDMPFSDSFLALLTGQHDTRSCVPASSVNGFICQEQQDRVPRFKNFVEIYPEQGEFFTRCLAYLKVRNAVTMSVEQIEQLEQNFFSSRIDDLCLTMEFPSISQIFGSVSFELRDHYEWEDEPPCPNSDDDQEEIENITANNLEIYIRRTVEFAMNKGIRKQMDAFKAGFNQTFPIKTLSIFTTSELGSLIVGEDAIPIPWTFHELMAVFEPVAGYTRQSQGYQLLLDVLTDFSGLERRAFVQFITGSPNLPPGGFRNLFPTMKVAKKDAQAFGPYPSVNTCMHYLKLPEYDSSEQLKEHLLAATHQRGFYLN